jgi:hypothetical protein
MITRKQFNVRDKILLYHSCWNFFLESCALVGLNPLFHLCFIYKMLWYSLFYVLKAFLDERCKKE